MGVYSRIVGSLSVYTNAVRVATVLLWKTPYR